MLADNWGITSTRTLLFSLPGNTLRCRPSWAASPVAGLWFHFFWIKELHPTCQAHNCNVFTVKHAVTVRLPESNASPASLFGALSAYLLLIHRAAHAKCMRTKYMCCLVFKETTAGLPCISACSVCLHFSFLTDSQTCPADRASFAPLCERRCYFKVSCHLWMTKWLNKTHLSFFFSYISALQVQVKDWQHWIKIIWSH